MDEAHLDDAIGTVNVFRHKLEKYVRLEEQDKIKSYLRKLQHYPITLEILQETGVGKTVNGLRKYGGSIGEKAKSLVNKWKTLVVVEEDDGPENEEYEPDSTSHCRPESPEHEPEIAVEEEGGMEIDETAFDEPEPREETPPPPTPPREPSSIDVKPFNGSSIDFDSGGEGPKSEPSSPPQSSEKKAKKRKKKSKDKDKTKEKDKKKEKEKHRESKDERKRRKLEKSPESKCSEKSSPLVEKSDRKLVECDMFASSSSVGLKSPAKKKHKAEKHEKKEKSPKAVKLEREANVEPEYEAPKPALLPRLEEMLPDISPDYRPSSKKLPPLPPVLDSPASSANLVVVANGSSRNPVAQRMTENEALCWAMSNKTRKTKIYSGTKSAKSGNAGEVPKLEALCVKVLGDNVKDLHKMPVIYGMPFEIIRQVLYRCNADQLLVLEEINPMWVEDSGKHWELLVKKEFKTEKRQDCEAWREMYLRCKDEREAKFKRLAESISRNANSEKSALKKTKLAYVDVPTKPAHRRAQVSSSTGSGSSSSSNTKVDMAASAKRASILKQAVGPANEASVSVPTAVRPASANGGGGGGRSSGGSAGQAKKPKVAPLMHKALQQMKRRFR